MKKTILNFLVATLFVLTSAVFGIKISEINTSPTPTPPDSSKLENNPRFVLKYSGGNVSLFEGDKVVETFSEVNFATLPPLDRENLTEGIEFDNLDEVYMMIEDFDG